MISGTVTSGALDENGLRLTFDVETFFDEQYSLRNKKLPIEAYIRDERFEPLALAYAFDDGPIHSVLGPEEIANWIADQDWSRITATCHNAIFDLGVLSFLFGVSPGGIIDTMALSRGVFGPGVSAKLKDIASRMGLPRKTISYEGFKGKHFADLPPVGLRHLAAGCERDVELTREIANRLLVDFPPGELEIIDLTVRGFTEPVLIGDCNALEGIALSEIQRKASAAKALGLVQKTVRGKETYPELTSSAKFVAQLAECGVEVEFKDGRNGMIPAIARTDAFMQSLRLRSDRAGQLAVARLDAKSSLNEDRAKRLANMARHGPMPVELKYCGAATTRFSGAGGANWQNLPNKRKDKELKLRGSIQPPPGQLLVVADFAQVELRVACALADEKGQLEALRDPTRDSYREFGEAHLYKVSPISKDQRAFAKKTVLGCIYGMGHAKFAETCQDDGLSIDLQTAKAAVDAFRRAYPAIVRFWKGQCTEALRILANADPCTYRLGPVRLKDSAVILPNGLRCPFVLEHDGNGGFIRTTRNGRKPYWGGSFCEFLCQSVSRVLLTDLILRVKRELGLRPALHVHDEIVYCVPETDAKDTLAQLIAWMSESPPWFPELPLRAEGWVNRSYKQDG